MVAVAKALADSARTRACSTIRGGLMQGRTITADDVEELAKLPPLDVLRGQVLAAVIAPLTQLARARERTAPEPVGLIDARIEQLGGAAPEPVAETRVEEPVAEAEPAGRRRAQKLRSPRRKPTDAPADESRNPNRKTRRLNDDGGS